MFLSQKPREVRLALQILSYHRSRGGSPVGTTKLVSAFQGKLKRAYVDIHSWTQPHLIVSFISDRDSGQLLQKMGNLEPSHCCGRLRS